MASRSTPFAHGFKAHTQRLAAQQRAVLGLRPSDPLDPRRLASKLEVLVVRPQDIASLAGGDLAVLMNEHPDAWSALSLETASGTVVIYNPTHEPGRINNSLAHELSHLLLQHARGSLHPIADCMMREYDERQEKEADWLAGSLLMPEAALREIRRRGWDQATAAAHYVVSEPLLRWRWNVSSARYLRSA